MTGSVGIPAETEDVSPAAPRRAAVVRIPSATGDRLSPASAAVIWAGARDMAAQVLGPGRESVTAPAGWEAFLGRWVDKDKDGAIRGIVSFTAALEGRMVVRRGALVARGARHEDLMLITPAEDGRGAECMYMDSAGYAIRYLATWTDGGRCLELASDSDAGEPRYRLTWRFDDPDTMRVTFELAPAGDGPLVRYAEGPLRRALPEA